MAIRRPRRGQENKCSHSRSRPQPPQQCVDRHAFVHTVIDHHSPVAYAEIHNDETAATAIGVLRREVGMDRDARAHRRTVLSDGGSA